MTPMNYRAKQTTRVTKQSMNEVQQRNRKRQGSYSLAESERAAGRRGIGADS